MNSAHVFLGGLPFVLFLNMQVTAQFNSRIDPEEYQKLREEYDQAHTDGSHAIEGKNEVSLRLRWLYEMRRNADGIIDEQHRWDEFRKLRSATPSAGESIPAADWISLGPNTIDSMAGRMFGHAFDPTDNRILWAGSGSGGLWRTTDGGESWQSMTDELPSLYVSCVEIKPTDRTIMLMGTGVDRFNALTLSTGVGVLKSTDGGLTWGITGFSYPASSSIGTSELLWHPVDQSTVYLAASNGVWKSTDEGDTWSLLKNGSASTVIIDPQSPDTMYTAIRNDGVYRTTDGGVVWSRLMNGLPSGSQVGLTSLDLCRSMPSVLYAGMTSSSTFSLLGLFKSTDGGDSWTIVADAPEVFCYPPPNETSCYGWANNVIGVSPVDPDLVVFGGVRLFRTSDGGGSWTWHDWTSNGVQYSNAGLTYVDQWDIGFDPVDPQTIYMFNDGGVQKSTDGGLWWNKMNNDLVTGQIYRLASAPSDTSILIGGFQDHGLQRLDNAGGNTRWFRWSGGDGTQVIIHPTDTDVFYGDLFAAYHVKSTNGGMFWRTNTFPINNGMTEPGQLFAPLLMHPQDPNTLFCAGLTTIFRTTNGGLLWSVLASIPNIYTMAIDPVNPSVMYAHAYTTSSWIVWRTTDSGASWTSITHPSIPSWRVVDLECDPTTSGTLYAVRNSASLNQDHVRKSTDFGETWVDITANLPDVTMSAIAGSPHSAGHLYVATDLGVFASTNAGTEWSEFNDGLPLAYAMDLHYHPLDRTLRLATLGRGAWKTRAMDAGVSGVASSDPLVVSGFRLLQNHPNPFNPSTTIRYTLQRQAGFVLTVHNELGQEIRRLVDGVIAPGSYTAVWDGRNRNGLPSASGVYFVRARANGAAQTIKIVLAH